MKKSMPWMGKESKMEEKNEKKKAGSKAAYAKGEKKEAARMKGGKGKKC